MEPETQPFDADAEAWETQVYTGAFSSMAPPTLADDEDAPQTQEYEAYGHEAAAPASSVPEAQVYTGAFSSTAPPTLADDEDTGADPAWAAADPAAPAATGVRTGATVRIFGLVQAARLNGLAGVAEEWAPDTGRWVVELPSGERCRVRPENLEAALAPPRGAAGRPAAGAPPAPAAPASPEEQEDLALAVAARHREEEDLALRVAALRREEEDLALAVAARRREEEDLALAVTARRRQEEEDLALAVRLSEEEAAGHRTAPPAGPTTPAAARRRSAAGGGGAGSAGGAGRASCEKAAQRGSRRLRGKQASAQAAAESAGGEGGGAESGLEKASSRLGVGSLIRVKGDGWGGGQGDYTATVTEADELSFTVSFQSKSGRWEETHVLREHCGPATGRQASKCQRRS